MTAGLLLPVLAEAGRYRYRPRSGPPTPLDGIVAGGILGLLALPVVFMAALVLLYLLTRVTDTLRRRLLQVAIHGGMPGRIGLGLLCLVPPVLVGLQQLPGGGEVTRRVTQALGIYLFVVCPALAVRLRDHPDEGLPGVAAVSMVAGLGFLLPPAWLVWPTAIVCALLLLVAYGLPGRPPSRRSPAPPGRPGSHAEGCPSPPPGPRTPGPKG